MLIVFANGVYHQKYQCDQNNYLYIAFRSTNINIVISVPRQFIDEIEFYYICIVFLFNPASTYLALA